MAASLQQEFCALRDTYIEKHFGRLNDMQRQAVFTTDGPLLILAGAGSGKTTVLVNRIANLIRFGSAHGSSWTPREVTEEDVKALKTAIMTGTDAPAWLDGMLRQNAVRSWNVMAITFTNKAAGELKERLRNMLGGEEGDEVFASTFHSACVRILRRWAESIGYPRSFTIYDTDDSQRVMKAVYKELSIDDKFFPIKSAINQMSRWKDQLVSPEEALRTPARDTKGAIAAKVYAAYEKKLREAGAFDFDDLIYQTVQLLAEHEDVREFYQNKYRYLLVDEYQDTSVAQFRLVSLLTGPEKNICVVGDDDQSIYRFRGATIENILGFEEEFPQCTVIRLEQNYRSTQNILDAANSVIANNDGRKSKHLWTDAGAGEKITWYKAADESDESAYVSKKILENVKQGAKYGDHAILYRMNAQSNMLERALVRSGVPYRIYGGTRFYDRKEIRDIIAYMSIVENPNDRVRFERIVNEPKRGIGDATLSLLQDITQDLHLSPLEVMRNADQYPVLSKKMNALKKFAVMWDELIEAERELPLEKFLDVVLEKTGYRAALEQMGEEGTFRLENVEELKSSILTYQNEAEEPSLGGFLEEISLYTDVDKYEPEQDVVMLMTVHSAKGLEFQNVFLVGMEQGVFPGNRSLDSREDLEEERRLAYVALTRAKKKLTLTTAASRMLFGMTMRNLPSQFLTEIDRQLIEQEASQRQSRRGISADKPESVQSISLQRQMASAKPQKYKAEPKEFHVGERVRHATFGDGTVLAITKMANDAMLEVGFDQVGTKRLMASHPKIKKLL